MTATELLHNSQPPVDDQVIEKAISDLDLKIWQWADALKSAQTQLRSAFAVRPAPVAPPATARTTTPGARASASLYDSDVLPNLSAAAAAAHIPTPAPMPAEWTAPPASSAGKIPPLPSEWAEPSATAKYSPSHGGHGASSGQTAQQPEINWAQAKGPAAEQNTGGGASGPGVMQWPSSPNPGWPDANASASGSGAQSWPTWTPSDGSESSSSSSSKKPSAGSSRSNKAGKGARPAVEGPSPEERAQKAATEEALLSELEEAIARRVRLLRRLDPDTAIEKLIEKATQGHAETMAAAPARDDKSSSSWWRRK